MRRPLFLLPLLLGCGLEEPPPPSPMERPCHATTQSSFSPAIILEATPSQEQHAIVAGGADVLFAVCLPKGHVAITGARTTDEAVASISADHLQSNGAEVWVRSGRPGTADLILD